MLLLEAEARMALAERGLVAVGLGVAEAQEVAKGLSAVLLEEAEARRVEETEREREGVALAVGRGVAEAQKEAVMLPVMLTEEVRVLLAEAEAVPQLLLLCVCVSTQARQRRVKSARRIIALIGEQSNQF